MKVSVVCDRCVSEGICTEDHGIVGGGTDTQVWWLFLRHITSVGLMEVYWNHY